MTPEEKKVLKEKIEKKLAKTERDIRDYKEMTKPVAPENAIGRLSRMEAINNKSVMEAALREAEIKYKNLQIALENIDSPDFGRCVNCGSEIPYKRLFAMPEALRCMACSAKT